MKLGAIYPFVDRESKFSLVVRLTECPWPKAWNIQTTGCIIVALDGNRRESVVETWGKPGSPDDSGQKVR